MCMGIPTLGAVRVANSRARRRACKIFGLCWLLSAFSRVFTALLPDGLTDVPRHHETTGESATTAALVFFSHSLRTISGKTVSLCRYMSRSVGGDNAAIGCAQWYR